MSKILKVVGASWLQTKISSYILGFLGVLAILALFVGQIERIQEDGNYAATVFYSEKTGYRIEYWGQSNELAEIPRGVARAYFRMDIETTGWSLLEVETEGSYPDEVQAYAAGIVEGALTWYLIHTHLENTIRAKCANRTVEKRCEKLRDTLDKSVNTLKARAAERGASEPFWHHVSLYYTQIDGIYTGWKHGVKRSEKEYDTDISDLFWLNSVAEVQEILKKINVTLEGPALDALPSLSSAFLRVVNETAKDGTNTKKLYVAHNSAGSYSSMTRILKRYKFNYHLTANDSSLAPGTAIDFSSYPGSVTSQDEFYAVSGKDHRLAVTGTPLRNYNSKLWKDVNITEEVPLGPRLTAANRLASNVSTWGHTLASYNSGTACKQWLVVDFTKFQNLHAPMKVNTAATDNNVIVETTVYNGVRHTVIHRSNKNHAKGLLWLLEQVPGHTHSADISEAFLEQTYWATYGLPFFRNISEVTRIPQMQKLHGKIFSETKSPRAEMFKRGYKNATTLNSIVHLMRQNNATRKHKGSTRTNRCANEIDCIVAEKGYWSMVGARGDMVQNYKEPYGVIDTKVVSSSVNATSLEFVAISGPPFTPINVTKLSVNKGNVASVYTDQFDNEPIINGIEIRDLVKQRQRKAEQEALKILNRDIVKPFQWSESNFSADAHVLLPDKWAFEPFQPKWSW